MLTYQLKEYHRCYPKLGKPLNGDSTQRPISTGLSSPLWQPACCSCRLPWGPWGNHKKCLWNKGGSGDLQAALICDLTKGTNFACDSLLISREQLARQLPLQVFSSSNFQISLQQTSEDYLSLVKKQWWAIQRLLPSLRRPPHLLVHLSASSNRQSPPITSLSSSFSGILPFFHSLFAFPFSPVFLPSYFPPSLSEHRQVQVWLSADCFSVLLPWQASVPPLGHVIIPRAANALRISSHKLPCLNYIKKTRCGFDNTMITSWPQTEDLVSQRRCICEA